MPSWLEGTALQAKDQELSAMLANPPVSSCQDEGGTASKEEKLGYLDTTLEMETLTGDGEGKESESEPPKL